MNLRSPHSHDLVDRLRDECYTKKHLELLGTHDEDSLAHSLRVGALAIDLGHENNLSDQEISLLGTAALLHDVGKCDIPKEILTKQGKLTPEERKEIENHTWYGFRRLKEDVFSTIRNVTLGHHEFTRTPYPRNKCEYTSMQEFESATQETDVTFVTQIIAISDMFDALVHKRSYKPVFAKVVVEKILYTQFTGEKRLIEQVLARY